MSRGSLVVVGDALLDRDLDGRVERLCPEAPVPVVDELRRGARPGGAGLAAVLAAGNREVTLVTAVGKDEAGAELRALLRAAGVALVDIGLAGPTPEKLRVRSERRLLLRIDGGGTRPGKVGRLTEAARHALRQASAVLVSDYGRGVAAQPQVRRALAAACSSVPVVWDPHPRGPEPVERVRLVTPNGAEAAALVPEPDGDSLRTVGARACELRRRFAADAVAVTLGENGAVLAEGAAPPLLVPAPPVVGGDPCGAGDRFASAAALALCDGAPLADAVAAAVEAASAFVAAGGAGAFTLAPLDMSGGLPLRHVRPGQAPAPDAEALAQRVRAAGGTVVATGGCFDLLHAGHVSTLEAARALGDCLIVCLNSDASVRRLKGRDRPLVPQADRAAVLNALACVDAVAVFDEDTPEALLDRLRPEIFAKGGDYAAADLPEAPLLESWGGRTVILPYVEGRSTTRLLEEVVLRGRP